MYIACSHCFNEYTIGEFVRYIDFVLCYNCLHDNYYRCNYHESETWFLLSIRNRTDEGNICDDCAEQRNLVDSGIA